MDTPNTPGSTDPQHTSYYGHWQPAARPGPHASNVNPYSPSTTIGAGPSYVNPEVTEMNSPNTPGSTDPQRTSYYGQPAARPGPRASNMNSYSSSATIGPGPFDVSPEMKAPNTPGSTHPQRTSYYGQPAARPRPRVSNVNSYSSQTLSEYAAMLVAGEEIPTLHNIIVGFFTWILLAGFMLFPGTFVNLVEDAENGQNDPVQSAVLGAVKHVPLFVIACSCSGIGVIGMCWFWYRWQANYVWLINHIFLTAALNSLAGVISTLATIYGLTNKITLASFRGSTKLTIIVTGGLTVTCGVLTLFFHFILVRNLKKKHDKEHGERRTGSHGQGQ